MVDRLCYNVREQTVCEADNEHAVRFVSVDVKGGWRVGMIAEIYHKVRSFSEDELTGNFFGMMRYFPFSRGLRRVFLKAVKSEDVRVKRVLNEIIEDDFEFEFWKRSEKGLGEIDGLIRVGKVGIGIEVKYCSGLSGEEQLEREAAMLEEWCMGEQKLLLLIATEEEARDIYLENYQKKAFENVYLGYLTWQDILLALDEVVTETIYEERILGDLKLLLTGKGFISFQGFEIKIPVEKGLFYEFG